MKCDTSTILKTAAGLVIALAVAYLAWAHPVGLEAPDALWADLEQALKSA